MTVGATESKFRRRAAAWLLAVALGCAPPPAASTGDVGAGLDVGNGSATDPNCGSPGFVTVDLDDGGVTRTVCPPDGPVWGVTDAVPTTVQAQSDGTLVDERTGLQWQLQALPGLLPQAAAHDACDKSTVAGREDWRLPTVAEAMTAIDFGHHDPALGLPLQAPPAEVLWTAIRRGAQGWTVRLDTGASQLESSTVTAAAWCVRGTPLAKAMTTPRFQRDTNGVVLDTWTGLTWQGTLPAGNRTLFGALGWCPKWVMEGKTWRLPTVEELASLLDRSHDPPIDYVVFEMGGTRVHSVSTTAADNSLHWSVDFSTGSIVALDADGLAFVRCVSGP